MMATKCFRSRFYVGFLGCLAFIALSMKLPGSENVNDGIPKGFKVIEGDIIVPQSFGLRRAAWKPALWPGGIVHYEFDDNVSSENRGRTRDAMEEWESVANVEFRRRDDEVDYIHIRGGDNNSSFVGMVNGEQFLNIKDWEFEFIIVHELGHALGS